MIRIMVILLVGLFVMNSILIQGIAAMVEDLHELHFGVPKNEPEEADEWRADDPSCRELAETEQEYELCTRLRKRYETPIVIDPRGTRSVGDMVEEGTVQSTG